MVVVAGASVQTFATQAAAVVWDEGAVQLPSLPIYYVQVDAVPVYELHDPNEETHPAPVVTHPV